jgi:hypothetical protein
MMPDQAPYDHDPPPGPQTPILAELRSIRVALWIIIVLLAVTLTVHMGG